MLLFAKENMFGDSGKVESTFKIIKKYWYIKIIRYSRDVVKKFRLDGFLEMI
jgi:hypothetical protein